MATRYRVIITQAPTGQVETIHEFLRHAALRKACQADVPARSRARCADQALRELSRALAGESSPERAARCVAGLLRTVGVEHVVRRA